ncbi:hypothetical protein RZS08_31030, partial [Arthrospira platensis SPKY1]|nr:hypothetical protein [Arthrospira platensis SPKY1]
QQRSLGRLSGRGALAGRSPRRGMKPGWRRSRRGRDREQGHLVVSHLECSLAAVILYSPVRRGQLPAFRRPPLADRAVPVGAVIGMMPKIFRPQLARLSDESLAAPGVKRV